MTLVAGVIAVASLGVGIANYIFLRRLVAAINHLADKIGSAQALDLGGSSPRAAIRAWMARQGRGAA